MRDRSKIDTLKKDRTCMERALAEVGAVRKGNAWRCPFHEDSNASAGIHQTGGDGTWLYTCKAAGCEWNNGKGSGDVFAVLARGGKNFATALEWVGGSANQVAPKTAPRRTAHADSRFGEQFARDCSARLLADAAALRELWRSRAVDRATVERFEVGTTHDLNWWTFTIRDAAGKFVAVKGHRRSGDGPKSTWFQKGTKSTQLYPVSIKLAGPVWLCPGELKALAVAAAGRNAVGITSGEDVALPKELAELLSGRVVAVAPDADKGGEAWLAKRVRPFCKEYGIELRLIDLGLSKDAGLKDVGDFITREAIENARDAAAIGATLDERLAVSEPWHKFNIGAIIRAPRTWERVDHIQSGFSQLDNLTGGVRTRAVHIFCGRTGRAKTQLVIAMAVNAATAGIPVGIVSLELDRDEITRLIVAARARVSRTRLDEGRLTDIESARVNENFEPIGRLPLTILDSDHWGAGLDRDGLASIVQEGASRCGWRFVVVDYFNLLAAVESDRSDYSADLLNSAALKRIARQNLIALNVVAALRKPPVSRKGVSLVPTLDEVAGAGRIVYDAASVWYVDSEQTGTDPPSGMVTMVPLKTRFSRAAHLAEPIRLKWEPGYGTITDEGAFP